MAISGSKMEAPVARKWPGVVMERERERERERLQHNEEEENGVRVLTFYVIITDGNNLMKRIVLLTTYYGRIFCS